MDSDETIMESIKIVTNDIQIDRAGLARKIWARQEQFKTNDILKHEQALETCVKPNLARFLQELSKSRTHEGTLSGTMYGDSCPECTNSEVKTNVLKEAAKILGPTFKYHPSHIEGTYNWEFSKPR